MQPSGGDIEFDPYFGFVPLDVSPNLSCHQVEGINIGAVGLAIVNDYLVVTVPSRRFTLSLLVDGIFEEPFPVSDHVVFDTWLDVPFSKSISDFSEPSLTSDKFWVDVLVSNSDH